MKNINKALLAIGAGFFALSSFTMNGRITPSLKLNAPADTATVVLAADAKPVLISDKFGFAEGPTVDKKGNLFVTDMPNDKIFKYDIDGNLSVWMEHAHRPNGMFMDKKGNLIVCSEEKNQLLSISPKQEVTVLLNDYQGHMFNAPNDVYIHKNGGMYITDPLFARDFWTRKKTSDLDGDKVYYLPKGASQAIPVVSDMKKPNGVVGTPDGKYLYVGDYYGKTYKYKIEKDGTLSEKTLFADQPSDGMTLDNMGNVYLTSRGVNVYSPQGKLINKISVPAPATTNVCFAGKNKDVLFITTSKALYSLQTKVKGVE
ncbi:MAG: SMP-30/gluconolactonase/LRE family protein [Mucilaginibacter sp.]